MVSDVSLEMQSDSKNYVGLQDDEITEPVHTIKSACASTGGGPARGPDERKKLVSRYPAAGKCFQNTPYPAVWIFPRISTEKLIQSVFKL